MRPMWIELENIGPFVKRARVDLTDIEEGGLFLISGPTGSGKSFIFDTICYALYGKTPSKREGHLRSDHAGVGDVPSIRFKFKVGEITYLIERTLEYNDHKRGSGITKRGETASLLKIIDDPSRIDGERDVVIASKKTEVNDSSMKILGLGMEQFSRVMMIPQGEFRELLRSETKDREALLRKLFDSLFYFKVSEELSRRYTNLNDRIKDSISRNETRIDTIVNKLDLETKPGEGLTFAEWTTDTLTLLDERYGLIMIEEKGAGSRWGSARKNLQMAEEIFRTDTDLKVAVHRMEGLKVKKENEIDQKEKKLQLASRASHLRPDLRSRYDLSREKDTLEKDIAELEPEIEKETNEFERSKERLDIEIPEREQILEDVKKKIASLEEAAPRVKEADGIKKEITFKKGQLKTAKDEFESSSTESISIEKRLSTIKKELEELPPPADIVRLSATRSATVDLLDILGRNGELHKIHSDKRALKDDAEERLKISSFDLGSLRKRRESSIASDLARGLHEDGECPVCGSTDHPKLAMTMDDEVKPEMIKEAELRVEKARSDLSSISKSCTQVKTSIEELDTRASQIRKEYKDLEMMNIEQLGQTVKEITDQLLKGKEMIEKKEILERERDNMISSKERSLEKMGPMQKNIHSLEIELARSTSRFEERSSLMSDLCLTGDDPFGQLNEALLSSRKKVEETTRWMDEMKQNLRQREVSLAKKMASLKNFHDRLDRIKKDLSTINRSLEVGISKIDGISSLEELENAVLEEEEESQLKVSIDSFKEEMARVEGSIGDLEKKLDASSIDVPTEVSLLEMRELDSDLENKWKEVHARSSQLEMDLKWTKDQIDDIKTSRKKMEDIESELSVVKRLSWEVKGNSNPRISLERFFLAQRFEEVLISSNQRLKVLSSGRFLLRRADLKGKKSKGGLDIDVYDNYTGQERPANTLSGGQMFLSSLALALGLADVVQSRSGGIRMDALFIDEGFGSLDDETLQTALKVLLELRKGRMVGVISHVAELKRQIRTGFEVVPSREGSTIRKIGNIMGSS